MDMEENEALKFLAVQIPMHAENTPQRSNMSKTYTLQSAEELQAVLMKQNPVLWTKVGCECKGRTM